MKIGVIRERTDGERRVALVPESIKRLVAKQHEVFIERGAGDTAGANDAAYTEAGGRVQQTCKEVVEQVEVLVKIHPPTTEEIALLTERSTVIALLSAVQRKELITDIAARGASALSLDAIPRSTAAQMMDVLSSQATLAGYRSVILAAELLPKIFPMMMTAAGTIPPAKVLVLGAGVAGLQAIATARRLGATVEAFDVRKVAKEQVESLGAKFVEVDATEDAQTTGGYAKETSDAYKAKQAEVLLDRIGKADVCITTALIPGRRAPILITAKMVRAMRPGSVIIDLAAEQEGNCELTRSGERVVDNGVTIVGDLLLPSRLSVHASQMFSRNVERLLLHLVDPAGGLRLDADDEIIRGVTTVRRGQIVDPRLKEARA